MFTLDTNLSLEAIQNIGPHIVVVQKLKDDLRLEAMKEAALSVGAQSGFAKRAKEINEMLERHAKELDTIYDFRPLMLKSKTGALILPPIIVESNDVGVIESDRVLNISGKEYSIVAKAEVRLAPPTWRDYLVMNTGYFEMPHESLLPQNDEERALWGKWVKDGWGSGVEQANSVYLNQSAKLKRDIKGLVLYHKLIRMNLLTGLYFAETENGIQTNGDELIIDGKKLMITSVPEFTTPVNEWKPIIVSLDH